MLDRIFFFFFMEDRIFYMFVSFILDNLCRGM